jgi:hypothetical protein
VAPARPLAKTLFLCLALAVVFAPGALAAEGVSPAKSLGHEKTTAGSLTTNGRAKATSTAVSKEDLSIKTTSPADGQTVSGKVNWEVSVLLGSPTKVEFAVDGSTLGSDSSAPFGVALDSTKLGNGNHTLTATASGSHGARATTSVTVKVANAAAGPAPTPEPEPTPAAGSGAPVYWGATIGTQLTGTQAPWDMAPVAKFEEETRKKVSMINFFQPFANCNPTCSFYGFPKTPLESIREHGSIPVLSWSSQSIPSSKTEPDFQLSDLIEGRYDAYITDFATKAKAWGHPFMLRFDWEMNGHWFPWHEGVNGNQPGEFVAAWRHVHDIFSSVGATNVTWVWCPNLEYSGSTPLAEVYPGDGYVDWTGLDGYNHGTNPAQPDSWKTFNQLYRSTYNNIVGTLAPAKPMMIGEVASTESGGSKAAWIKDMLARVPAEYPKIRALLYFDKYDSNMDWPLETSESALAAFAEGIQNPAYVGNTFSSLSTSTVLPPS